MMYRHLRTNTLYRTLLHSFDVAAQQPCIVYMSMDTGEVFHRSLSDFHEKFILVNDPQENIRPKNEARTIYLNHSPVTWHGYTLSYEQILELLGESHTAVLSMVYHSPEARQQDGPICKGETIKVYPDMRITAMRT